LERRPVATGSSCKPSSHMNAGASLAPYTCDADGDPLIKLVRFATGEYQGHVIRSYLDARDREVFVL